MDEVRDVLILIVSLLCLCVALVYAGYRYGRYFERKVTSVALVKALEDTYYDGYGDGYAAHLKESRL